MYIRLSREDGDKQESESIGNQRKILQRYIKENKLEFIKEYIDDGISGTTFERPGFCEMIKDIRNKNINMVITKDLSRLGRDYIKTGFYIEDYFPKNDIRYVAITDGIDTYIDNSNNDITPFKAIMNDMYAKDISKKIRSVLKEKQQQGEYMCSIPAYGYKKDPNIKNKLIIDEQSKDVIKKIFNMYVNGHGSGEIAEFLNSNNYLSPSGYRKTGLIKNENKTNYKWNEVTICNMLKNEVYIGNTVQNKKSKISYKVKKVKTMDKSEQIRVNNTHESIINKDIFEKAQCIIEKKGANKKLKYDYLLRGLIYCNNCKRKLQIVLKKNYPYITCSNAKIRGCYPLNINYKKMESHIIYIIRKICQAYENKEKLNMVYEKYEKNEVNTQEEYNKKKIKLEKLIFEINNNLDQMYIDKLNGIIQKEDYIRVSRRLNLKKEELYIEKQRLNQNLNNTKYKSKRKEEEVNKIIEDFLKLENIKKIYLYRLINKIEIDKEKNVYIFFNFSVPNYINIPQNNFIKIEELLKN